MVSSRCSGIHGFTGERVELPSGIMERKLSEFIVADVAMNYRRTDRSHICLDGKTMGVDEYFLVAHGDYR